MEGDLLFGFRLVVKVYDYTDRTEKKYKWTPASNTPDPKKLLRSAAEVRRYVLQQVRGHFP